MEINELITWLTQHVGPLLPSLTAGGVLMGKEAVKELGKNLGGSAGDAVGRIWPRLAERVAKDPASVAVVRQLAERPDDPDAQAAFRFQLRQLLERDPALRDELRAIIEPVASSTVTVRAHGDGSIAVGGDVVRSRLSTGDRRGDQA